MLRRCTDAGVPRVAIELDSFKCWLAFVTGWPVGLNRVCLLIGDTDLRPWLCLSFQTAFKSLWPQGKGLQPPGSVVWEVICIPLRSPNLLSCSHSSTLSHACLHVHYCSTPFYSYSRWQTFWPFNLKRWIHKPKAAISYLVYQIVNLSLNKTYI